MIELSLKLAAYASFLSSDKAIEQAQNSLLSKRFNSHSIKDYQSLFAEPLRDDDIEAVYNWLNLETLTVQQVLSQLAGHFLEWQGDRFEVKTEHLDEWLTFVSLVDCSWVIAQAYVDLMVKNDISSQQISDAIALSQCPVALHKKPVIKKFADNHIHLGGHGHTGNSLLSFALFFEKSDGKVNWPTRSEYSVFESGKLSKDNLPYWVNSLGNKLCHSLFDRSVGTSSIPLNSTLIANNHQGIALLQTSNTDTQAQKIAKNAVSRINGNATVWIEFCVALLHGIGGEEHPRLEQFIRVSNIFRNYMIVSGVGLTQFVDFFRFKHRKGATPKQAMQFSQQSLRADMSNTVREFRVGPNILLNSRNLVKTVPDVREYLEQFYQENAADNAHFVVHFTRSGKREDKRQERVRLRHLKMARSLVQFMSSVAHEDSLIPIELTAEQLSFDLRKAIRGFDVAGNENHLPIEVFAPVLRVLRSAKFSSQGMFGTRIERPFLTVHAGEDFSHLLTGLRNIDEAVVFCDFQQGDRIGHALALGVNPRQWLKRQQTAYLPVGEHLDNLVWAHQKAIEVLQLSAQFTGVLPLLEQKIQFWSKVVYGEDVSPYDLYRAWLLRRNCPLNVNLDTDESGSDVSQVHSLQEDWVIDKADLESKHTANQKKLWSQYLFSNEKKEVNYDQTVAICSELKGSDTFGYKNHCQLFDSISEVEIKLYEAIQDILMERYAVKGIVLEACPTSNIYIGRFKHYHEHPIYRWHPPEESWLEDGGKFNKFGLRNGSVPVCINTDDSALMPTTIRNEHRVVKEAAVNYFGVGVNKAEDWIDRIRQKGVEVFEENHLDWVN
ncbi:antiviral RADAR system adenosine deaminase RdrB [Vibrio sp. T20]|uniref:antiviral RADAR system adenosine deaminase RdrB n=1 Tax=Vibrio sp. T20 TaxID=2588450 RepID=UPI0011B62C17|nr:antiviral RADAR system adenosine deaminase RdrB [Vibrio sp. T20]